MITPKVIKSQTEYETVLQEIGRLMELNPQPSTPEAEQLELFAVLVQNYESKNFSTELPDPIDAIEFRMEQQGLEPRDLIPYVGGRSKVSEILSRKRPLTLNMIRALHEGLGIPAEVLVKAAEPEIPEEPDWNRFPLREMIERGWVTSSFTDIKNFFTQLKPRGLSTVLYRKSDHVRSARKMDPYALAAWVTRIISVGLNLPSLPAYKPGSLDVSFMRELSKLSTRIDGPIAAQVYLADHGVPLVIEPHLSHTHLDGAAILVFKTRPIIGMSLRHDRLDNFWFTLMHEVAHIALHSGGDTLQFIDDLDTETPDDTLERQADDLAGEALIPKDAWFLSAARRLPSPEAAMSLATKLAIHPAIVAGKMRHERKAFRTLNNLVGHREVRKLFPEVKWKD